MFQVLHDMRADLVVSANTIAEVSHARVNPARLQWALSRVKVEPVTETVAKAAAQLLKGAVCTDTGTRSTPPSRKRLCAPARRSSSRRAGTPALPKRRA
ncbi:hypothetical protein FHS42_001365 [Streptomyces zagrosensis]|uniref:Uncharacterized protein n=1 Tax=Streptomyces zagrosensis TaxID=1042984 RepID=A0A7W9Q652_9ACTN|nr:hypothetical protein [Streptomyces zagrosensis]